MSVETVTEEVFEPVETVSIIEEMETEMEEELELPSNHRLSLSGTPKGTPSRTPKVTKSLRTVVSVLKPKTLTQDRTPKDQKKKAATPNSRRKAKSVPKSTGRKKKKASKKKHKVVTKTIKKTITTRKTVKKTLTQKINLTLNCENKIVLKERRFYAWGGEDGDQTVIEVLKKAGWTYCGEPVPNGREDYPYSMYEAKDAGTIDKGPALFWADDDDSKVLQGLSNEHLISSIPLAAKALTKTYQQLMFNDFDWFPKCFTVPKETEELNKYIEQHPESHWICKPDDSYGGFGMCVYNSQSELFKNIIKNRKGALAVQLYMHNPYLFAGLYKFHFRCYMVISNVKPLRAYLWKNAQIQFATHPFDLKQIEGNFNKFAHITNYKVNNQKNNSKYAMQDKPGIGIGTEWSFERFATYMQNEPKFSREKFWKDLRVIAREVANKITSSKPVQKSLSKTSFSTNHFEVYGLDILMDENCNIAMTEANTTPGLDDTDPKMKNGVFNPEAVKANDITHGIILDALSLILDDGRPLFSPFLPLHR